MLHHLCVVCFWLRPCTLRQLMRQTSIRWRQDRFVCEYRLEETGGCLYLFADSDELVREPVTSAEAAYARARERSDSYVAPRVKRA